MASIYKIGTYKDLISIDKSKPLFFDTETGGLNYSTWVLGQFFQEGWDSVICIKMQETSADIVWELMRGCTLVGHNLLYDLHVLGNNCSQFEIPENWEDTFYASRLAAPKWQEYGLDKCLTKVLGYDPYARLGLKKKDMQKSFDPNKEITHEQLLYGSVDVWELPKLWNKVKHIKNNKRLNFNYMLDKRIAEMAVGLAKRGMPVNFDILEEMVKADRKELTQLKKKLKPGLNVNSYVQVREWLGLENVSDEVTMAMIIGRPNGVENYKGTYKKSNVVYKDVIVEPNYRHEEWKVEAAKNIVLSRKALKRLNFVQRAKKYAKKDEEGIYRIASRFSPHAITGRVQGEEENLSQYPGTMKRMWGFPENSDRYLIWADYSQLELRCIAAILPEESMVQAYREGKDLHTHAADNIDIDEAMLPRGQTKRFLAKNLNFLALYGGGKSNFQRVVCKRTHVWLDSEVVSLGMDQWKEGFQGIKKWHAKNSKDKLRLDTTISGRPYKAKNYTDLNNIKNQGSGAEVFKLADNYIDRYKVADKSRDRHLLNLIHDAVVMEANGLEAAKEVAYGIAYCFQKSWFAVMKQAPVKDLPMPVTVNIGKNWGDMEKGNNIVWSFTLDGMVMYDKELKDVSHLWS